MRFRFFEQSDLPRVHELHERKAYGYPLPPMSGPGFAFGVVAEDNGQAQIIAFLRLVPEAYLLMNELYATPEQRWEALKKIHEAVRALALRRGFNAVYCWLPPELAAPYKKRLTFWQRIQRAWTAFQETHAEVGEKAFVRRLKKLGWTEDSWPNYTFNLR